MSNYKPGYGKGMVQMLRSRVIENNAAGFKP